MLCENNANCKDKSLVPTLLSSNRRTTNPLYKDRLTEKPIVGSIIVKMSRDNEHSSIVPMKVAIIAAFLLSALCLSLMSKWKDQPIHLGMNRSVDLFFSCACFRTKPKIMRLKSRTDDYQTTSLAIHNKWPRKETLTYSCDILWVTWTYIAEKLCRNSWDSQSRIVGQSGKWEVPSYGVVGLQPQFVCL